MHKKIMPSSGGISFIFTYSIFAIYQDFYLPLLSLPLAFIGMIDDKFNISKLVRYIFQVVTLCAIVFYISKDQSVFISKLLDINSFFIILIIFFGTIVVNSINFMDGIDGLICGSMIMIFLTLNTNFHYLIPIIGTLSAAAVQIHMKFDQVTRGTVGGFGGKSKDAEIFEKALESGSDCLITGKACAEGGNSTVWMFIAIGIASLIYLVYLLVKHRDGPTVSFIIASIVIFFGCVWSGTREAYFVNADLGTNLQYILNYAPQYFTSEYLRVGAGLPDFSASSSLLVSLAYAVSTLAGIVLFTSAISRKVITESPLVFTGVFKTSSIVSYRPGTLISKLPSPVS